MFEKEAKEYEDSYIKSKYCEHVSDTWKHGAEFGYNKAIEWHDLRKNPDDLPREEEGQLYVVYWRLGLIDGYSVVRKIVNPLKDVIAWCRVPCYDEATGYEFKMIVYDELEVPTGDNG